MEYGHLKITDNLYPKSLKNGLGKYAPKDLYYMGNIELLKNNGIGFCGSRDVSEDGVEASKQCSLELIRSHHNIISGYARGVDRTVHLEALENSGNTIIVLPEGIERFRIHSIFKNCWDWDRVLVISEFNPSDGWTVYNAMKRNKTIVALSNAMLVIEAKEKGGTFEAGKAALRLKKPLFVVEYANKTEYNEGNRFLLNKGATTLKKSRKTLKPKIDSILLQIKQATDPVSLFG
jgi:DNA processing protein